MIPTTDIPQANRLGTVADLVALIDAGMRDGLTLARQLGVDPRQIDYYKHAARILGFIEQTAGEVSITDKGRAYLQAKRPLDKFALLSEAVRDSAPFGELFAHNTEAELGKSNIVEFLRHRTTLTGTTLARRADSVIAWLKTISNFDPEDLRSLAKNALDQAPAALRKYTQGEEGYLHQRLKTMVAEEPAVLGEQLALIQVEYEFPTGDRADILFVDSKARFLAIEVEVDVGALDVVGLLQAIKYRAMIMVQFGLAPSGVRGMLVARSIDPIMQKRAARYDIETREISGII